MTPEEWHKVKEVLQGLLELDPQARADYLDSVCPNGGSLRGEVESLLRSHEEDATFLEQAVQIIPTEIPASAAAESWIGKHLGPYQVLEQIGKGGMGEVFRACRADDQFQKQVAIKLLRAGEASPFVVSRFRNERQILASLDHPNIARLIDGGTTDKGIPYLVMELVEGMRIDNYCDTHKLSTTQRLKLFLEVCSAVQYAHQRLIVHRDLKPSNILVTKEGVHKLLDFGIAKILDPSALAGGFENTLTLYTILTPGYASPEQVRSEPITTASDVYSLGVILYELLTGRSPYGNRKRSPDEISRAVGEVYPEKPSNAITRAMTGEDAQTPRKIAELREGSTQKLRKRLRGDIDNIVLMALRKDPQQRYASVEQFSQDIHRHLVGLPVIARTDTFLYRATKFTRRHMAGVIAGASISIVLIIALIVTLHEARVAQRRFNDIRALANSLIFDVHDSIRALPGATAARQLIVERAQHYLDNLAAESNKDPALLRELAASYERLGSIVGNSLDANLGNSQQALKDYQHAVELRESVSATWHPVDSKRELARSYLELSYVLMITGQQPSAQGYINKALAVLQPLAISNPGDREVQYALAKAFERNGASQTVASKTADALSNYERSLQIYQQLLQMDPKNALYSIEVAFAHKHVGGRLGMQKQWQAALEHYETALAIDRERLRADPDNSNTRYAITYSYSDIGWILGEQGKVDAALDSYRHSVDIRSQLAAADAKDTRARVGLGNNYHQMAWLFVQKGDFGQALDYYKQAFNIRNTLSRDEPSNQAKLVRRAVSEAGVGYAYFQLAFHERRNEQRHATLCHVGESWAKEALPDLQQHRSDLGGEEGNFIHLLQDAIQHCKVGG